MDCFFFAEAKGAWNMESGPSERWKEWKKNEENFVVEHVLYMW